MESMSLQHSRVTPRWSAVIKAGLIAGTVFLILEMLMVWVFMGMSPWAPPRMMAAMAMGQGVLPPPATFDFGIVMVAMIVHFALSIALAVILAYIITRFTYSKAVLVGALFGLAVYLVNFHLIAPIMFPWFTMAQNWISVFAHIVFGLVLAAGYKALDKDAARGATL